MALTEDANFGINGTWAITQTEVAGYTKLHKSRLQLWKRKIIILNNAGVGRQNCRRKESHQSRERLFQGDVESIILLN